MANNLILAISFGLKLNRNLNVTVHGQCGERRYPKAQPSTRPGLEPWTRGGSRKLKVGDPNSGRRVQKRESRSLFEAYVRTYECGILFFEPHNSAESHAVQCSQEITRVLAFGYDRPKGIRRWKHNRKQL